MTSATVQLDVVTGAFSYSGAAIARELRAAGHRVRGIHVDDLARLCAELGRDYADEPDRHFRPARHLAGQA